MLSNPEFLRQGSAVYDFFHPNRIVIGGKTQDDIQVIKSLYEPLYRRDIPVIETNLETAELAKYASNAFLATKISFINEMANLSEKVGSNIQDIAKIMGMDNRIGKYFLHPGPGYGGSCFPKDTQALLALSETMDTKLPIVAATEITNHSQKTRIIPILEKTYPNLSGLTLAILGLSFKPNTDDIREAPAMAIIQALLKQGCHIRVYDPEAMNNTKSIFQDSIYYAQNSYDAAKDTDGLLLVTEWNNFRDLDLDKLKSSMKQAYMFDLRNIYKPHQLEMAGFKVFSIGHKQKISKKI